MNKVLVLPFYRAHAGFFILLFLLAFGFIKNTEHLAIASYFSANTHLLILLILVWSIYILRTTFFLRSWIQQSQNFYWLQQFILLPRLSQLSLLWFAQLLINLPVALYGAFIAIQGVIQLNYLNAILIVLFNISAALLPAFLYRKILYGLYPEEMQSKVSVWFSIKWTKHKLLWFVLYQIKHKPLALILCKLISFFIIIAVFNLYHTDAYDWRLLAMGVFLAFYMNSILVYNNYQLYTEKLPILNNLPISAGKRTIQQVLEYTFLAIPEWIIMVRYWPQQENIWVLMQALVFGITVLWMLHQYMIHTGFRLEKSGAKDFFLFVCIIILLLFSVPIWVFILIFFIYSLWINFHWYSRV